MRAPSLAFAAALCTARLGADFGPSLGARCPPPEPGRAPPPLPRPPPPRSAAPRRPGALAASKHHRSQASCRCAPTAVVPLLPRAVLEPAGPTGRGPRRHQGVDTGLAGSISSCCYWPSALPGERLKLRGVALCLSRRRPVRWRYGLAACTGRRRMPCGGKRSRSESLWRPVQECCTKWLRAPPSVRE